MQAEGKGSEAPAGFSDGQKYLYRLMQRIYKKSGPDSAIPASEIAGLMEYGTAAYREDDQSFWQDGVGQAGTLPPDWYEREEAAGQYFTRLGLVPVRAVIEPHTAANN